MNFVSEKQKEIVTSISKYKLINGCAGSCKTDTLIKCIEIDLKKGKRTTCLTQCSSVTDEIKTRVERSLGIKLKKQGFSNHYLGYYNGIPICISNFDSWIHIMLTSLNQDFFEIVDCFNEKAELLLEIIENSNRNINCYMKNNIEVDLIIIDEAQDLSSTKMKIIINLIKKNKNLDVIICGDILQTLYIENVDNEHPLNLFKRIEPTCYNLNICFRCPKGHIDFNNYILNDAQKKYFITNMESSNDNVIDKPFLFPHLSLSHVVNAEMNAEIVTRIIEVLMEKDKSIEPDDIAIIMKRTSENNIFYQLIDKLKIIYKKFGFVDKTYHMTTDNGTGNSICLDWTKAKGKTKLCSIHADKGKGHKVVFFLGLSENSIPNVNHLFKSSEIISHSILNVGLTRSKKYLFIGFTYNYISRYLLNVKNNKWKFKDKLLDYVYNSWDLENIEKVPEPYYSIIMKSFENNNNNPLFEQANKYYMKIQSEIGTKSQISIKEDISKDFEQPKNFVFYQWKKEEKQTLFGENQEIKIPFQEDHFIIFGVMSELLIKRKITKEYICNLLIENNNSLNNIYTTDERFLNFMHDMKNLCVDDDDINERIIICKKHLDKYDTFLKQKDDNIIMLRLNIEDAFINNKKVFHSIFKTKSFQQDLENFLSLKSNNELDTVCIWNVTLFWIQITQSIYRPSLNSLFSFFNENINVLHKNIKKFIEISNIDNNINILYDQKISIYGNFTQYELMTINKENHNISIYGKYDFYDISNKILYGIKASNSSCCCNSWIIQCLCYAMMLNIFNKKVEKICIVNIFNGNMYEWILPEMPKFEEIIETKISKKYQWHPIETQVILKSIQTIKASTLSTL